MKITNNKNLPKVFYDMVKENQYSFTPKSFGVTTLLSPTQQSVLQRRHYEKLSEDISDMTNLIFGSALHNEIKRYEDPTQDPMDRHQIKLHRKASDLIVEHADAVFFCARKLGTVSVKGKSGGMTTKVHKGERTIFTEDDPGYLAKNRYGLPPELPMDWEVIRKEMLK